MKIIIAPDSFKGTLTSVEVIIIMKEAVKAHFPDADIVSIPFADGGEGTLEAFSYALDADIKIANVLDPLGRKIDARFGIIQNKTAIIEMAQASGLDLLEDREKNPLKTTSYGTGELILEALNLGIRDFVVGIGGSATNDGGVGALMALGMEFLDENHAKIGFGGEELINIQSISDENLDKRLADSNISVICDVTNFLTGKNGASYVYGPQKGADESSLEKLELGMCHYADLISRYKEIEINTIAGSGAAGGLGAGLIAFLGAKLKPGVETMLEVVDFDMHLVGADFVITGEGRIDSQTINGKAVYGIAQKCKTRGIPVLAVVGAMEDGGIELLSNGISSIMPMYKREMSFEQIKKDLVFHLKDSTDRMLRFVKVGMKMGE